MMETRRSRLTNPDLSWQPPHATNASTAQTQRIDSGHPNAMFASIIREWSRSWQRTHVGLLAVPFRLLLLHIHHVQKLAKVWGKIVDKLIDNRFFIRLEDKRFSNTIAHRSSHSCRRPPLRSFGTAPHLSNAVKTHVGLSRTVHHAASLLHQSLCTLQSFRTCPIAVKKQVGQEEQNWNALLDRSCEHLYAFTHLP